MNKPPLSNRLHIPPQPLNTHPSQRGQAAPVTKRAADFRQVLDTALAEQPLRFSKHAHERLERRQIALSEADVLRLTAAVDKAATKGARDSLIMLGRTAFIVNIPRRTVVTAVDEASTRENVFTNIDSAVILN